MLVTLVVSARLELKPLPEPASRGVVDPIPEELNAVPPTTSQATPPVPFPKELDVDPTSLSHFIPFPSGPSTVGAGCRSGAKLESERA
eukprot:8293446-Pyramimonas_sp.AAC.1